MASFKPFASGTYTLGTSISSTQTTITLTSFIEPVSGTPYTMANIGSDIAFGTIQPRTVNSEFISFTGITQNADGTATLTGVTRGLAKKTPFTSDTTFKLPHAGQSTFIISDAPQLFYEYMVNINDETITGLKTFSQSPIAPTPTTATQVAIKSYVDGVAIAGAPDSSTTVKGIVKMSTAPASPTSPIAVGDNDPRVPSATQVLAAVGNNTDIAVGTGNKFVTQTGLQHNAEKYAADAGANDTYVVTLSPVPTSLTAGMVVHFKANTINTGAATLNVNSLGAKTIVKGVNTTLVDGDILAGQFCTVIYDGTNFVLQNPVALNNVSLYTNGTTSKNAADATATQTIAHGLGKIPKFVEINCTYFGGFYSNGSSTTGTTVVANSVYNGTTQSSYSIYTTGGGNSTTANSLILNTVNSAGSNSGVITFDATNINIVWTNNGSSPGGTYNMLWKAYA